jgi:hypothetical protein
MLLSFRLARSAIDGGIERLEILLVSFYQLVQRKVHLQQSRDHD